MKAQCKLCNREVTSLVIGSDQEKSFALGELLLDHMGRYHGRYLKQLSQDTKIFSGFVIMNRFTIDDITTNDEVEDMREKLANIIMEDGPLTEAEEKLAAIDEIINGSEEDEIDEEEENRVEEVESENKHDNEKEEDKGNKEEDVIIETVPPGQEPL